MAPKETAEAMEVEEAVPTVVEDKDLVTLEKIREQCRLIERGEAAKEGHYMGRVLRQLVSTRKALNDAVLARLLHSVLPASPHLPTFAAYLSAASAPDKALKDADRKAELKSTRSGTNLKKAGSEVLPEVELYLHLLFVVFLLDKGQVETAHACVSALVTRLDSLASRRSLSALAARVIYYRVIVEERLGRLPALRDWLHARLTLASLRREEECEAVLINALLRSYLLEHMYQPALKLIAKVTFPENANSNEWARHLYYLGMMKAMETDYAGAQKCLSQALSKAPKDTAVGFKQRVTKASVVVELLLAAEFPDRALFRHAHYAACLRPYLRLTAAVRIGDVKEFAAVLREHEAKFQADGTLTLITRLKQNVVKTAIRQMSLAYSRISIADVQKKLGLDSPDDAEYILSKAAKEGVLEGSVDHSSGWLVCGESADVYKTAAPAQLLHTRTAYCLKLHNQAVKAMRFPPKSYQTELESAEEQREREAQELEFAKEMAEDDDFE